METLHPAIKTTHLESGILHVLLNRPDTLNALNRELLYAFHAILLEARETAAVRALLISGSGKAFCAGADINQLLALQGESGLAFAREGQAIFNTLEQLGKPSLAAIHGFALGGGCELAMAATLRICAQRTSFGQPEVKLGVIPGFGGTQRLARLVGKGRALDLCLTGRMLKAEEAHAWGLVSEVVDEERLLERGEVILKEILNMGPLALKSVMTVIDYGYNLSMETALELEAAHFGLCCATQDKLEGVNAFLEKRTPEFSGV